MMATESLSSRYSCQMYPDRHKLALYTCETLSCVSYIPVEYLLTEPSCKDLLRTRDNCHLSHARLLALAVLSARGAAPLSSVHVQILPTLYVSVQTASSRVTCLVVRTNVARYPPIPTPSNSRKLEFRLCLIKSISTYNSEAHGNRHIPS